MPARSDAPETKGLRGVPFHLPYIIGPRAGKMSNIVQDSEKGKAECLPLRLCCQSLLGGCLLTCNDPLNDPSAFVDIGNVARVQFGVDEGGLGVLVTGNTLRP